MLADRTIFPPASHASFVFSHQRADEMLRARYAEIARDHPRLSSDCYGFSWACYNAFKAVVSDRGFTAINHTAFEQGGKYHPSEVVLADASADLARSLASQPSLLQDLENQIQPASSPSLSRFVKPPTEFGVQTEWEEEHGFGDGPLYTDNEDGGLYGMEEGWTTPVEEMFPPLFSPGSPVVDNTPPLSQTSVGSSPPGMQCGAASSAWPVNHQGSYGGISRRYTGTGARGFGILYT